MKFKKIFFGLTFIIFPLAISAQAKVTVSINNSSALERKEAVVSIKWESVLALYPQIDTTNFVVINATTKKQVSISIGTLRAKNHSKFTVAN